jgi:hypothetical protein
MVTIGDVVLIYHGEKPAFFARIDAVEPDIKKDWFRVRLLVLAIPLSTITWVLREEYINGVPFTMGGNPIRIEAIDSLPCGWDSGDTKKGAVKQTSSEKEGKKVIPFRKSKSKV